MDNMDKLRENIGAALDKTKLTAGRAGGAAPLRLGHPRRSPATAATTCAARPSTAPVQIGPTLRYLMYHDVYGKSELAKDLYRKLPAEARADRQGRLRPGPGRLPPRGRHRPLDEARRRACWL